MTKTQAKKVKSLTEQLAAAMAIESMFSTAYGMLGRPELSEGFGTGWNAAHDMVSAIQQEIHEAGLPEIPASELGTAELVALNID